jgi:hypothetical protein
MSFKSLFLATATSLVLSVSAASAGPFIISGTDSDDHGFTSSGVNEDGWFYMQKAIENIAGGVTNGFKNIVSLGSDPSTQAGNAASSAFGLSSISGTWTYTNINGTSALTDFFAGTGTVNVNNTGILLIDSGTVNVSGGITGAEEAILTANAALINSFVGAGGGLFAQASELGWLSALIPGIVTVDVGGGGFGSALVLTAGGQAAFPGLTNADISSGPWHHHFTNYSPLNLLAESTDGFDVIIGAAGGSITDPDPVGVPEPITLTLFGAGVAGAAALRRRKAKTA